MNLGRKRVAWLLLCLCLASRSGLGQSRESVPVPEYYGIYAVVEGKLVKLDGQQVRAEQTVSVRLGQRNGVGNILQGQPVGGSTALQIARFNPNLKIVVFSQPSGLQSPLDVAKSLHLESLVFVRNLTVDTGFPNNVHRSGPENGWEDGDAPELLGVSSGDRSKQLEFLIRPMPGHQDMVIAELADSLTPGVYRLSVGERDPFFGRGGFLFAVEPVADGENAKCVNAVVTYSMNMSNSKYTPCGGAQQAVTRVPSPQPGAPTNDAGGAPISTAQSVGQFQLAHRHSTFFNLQSSQAQSSCSGVLAVLPDGTVKYDCSQTQDPSGRCDHLTFAPDSFKNVKIGFDGSLHIATKTQGNFDFVGNRNSIKQAYNLITAGPSRKSSQPETSSAPQPPQPAQPVPPNTPTCSQSADAGYSLLLQGRLYKVQTVGPSGPNQVHLFFDDKNRQVTDSGILQQLTAAAWARDNVVASPDARSGARRVSGILGTSKALQNYSNVQDALARGMVEAVEAVVTDGASLSKVVPNLTVGVVKNQLKTAPKTVFVLAAQVGLQQSLTAYNQMESVPVPPADATVLNAPDLIKIKTYYLQARTLELPYEALAAKLMPTTASQLTNQAFASAISEIIPSVGFSSTEVVTLDNLFTLQKSVANLSDTLPATQAYSQNLKLALDLADANNRAISASALAAASPCGKAPAAEQSSSTRAPILGQLMFVSDQQFAVAPFLTYESRRFVILPTGTRLDSVGVISKQDLLPSGDINPSSNVVQAALRASPLNTVHDFTIYRAGTRLGTFSVSDVKVAYFGAMLKAAGFGQVQGFAAHGGEIAVAGTIDRNGFWSQAKLTSSQQIELRASAMALLPKVVPANRTMPQAVGKPIVTGKADEHVYVFDLNRDGNTEAYIRLRVPLRLATGTTLPDAYIGLLAQLDRTSGHWQPIFSSVYSSEGETFFGKADSLPISDASIDTVVASWTLCSIPNISKALQQMKRVLRTSGQFIFIEHGRSDDAQVVAWQDRMTPIWKPIGGGCHLNRKMDEVISSAGFRIIELKTFYLPGPRPMTYTYQGVAKIA